MAELMLALHAATAWATAGLELLEPDPELLEAAVLEVVDDAPPVVLPAERTGRWRR